MEHHAPTQVLPMIIVTPVIIVTSRHLEEEAAYSSTSKHFCLQRLKAHGLNLTQFFLSPEGTNSERDHLHARDHCHVKTSGGRGSLRLNLQAFLSQEVKSSRLKPPSSKGFSRGSTLQALHVTSHLRPSRVSATNGWSPCLDMVKTLTWQPQA